MGGSEEAQEVNLALAFKTAILGLLVGIIGAYFIASLDWLEPLSELITALAILAFKCCPRSTSLQLLCTVSLPLVLSVVGCLFGLVTLGN